jgi:hypothetical protein
MRSALQADRRSMRWQQCPNKTPLCRLSCVLDPIAYFVSHDLHEPPHVHVERDEKSAKFWLQPVALARNLGFSPQELRAIERIAQENRAILLEGWNEHLRRSGW